MAGTRGKMTKPAIGPGVRLFSPAVLGFSTASPTAGTSSGRSGQDAVWSSLSTILKPTTTLLVLRFWAFRKLERWHSCNAKDVWVASILIIAHQDGVIRGHPLHSGASLPFSSQCPLTSKKTFIL